MNKRGYIRILEATIAVVLVLGVVLTLYNGQQTSGDEVVGEFVSTLQDEILGEIRANEDYRLAVLTEDPPQVSELETYVGTQIPNVFSYSLEICGINDICKLDEDSFRESAGQDVFVKEVYVSSNLNTYAPKKVLLFIWQN